MIWIKMLIGALMVLIIQLVAQTRFFYVAALAPLFPTFTLISHFIVGTERSGADLKVALLFSIARGDPALDLHAGGVHWHSLYEPVHGPVAGRSWLVDSGKYTGDGVANLASLATGIARVTRYGDIGRMASSSTQ